MCAALWTINNFLNQSQNLEEGLKQHVLQGLTENGVCRTLKTVHECYRFARQRNQNQNQQANGSRASIFSPFKPDQGPKVDQNSYVKELYWCYNYLVGLGSQFSETLLSQHDTILKFILDDISASSDLSQHSQLDLSPAVMALCTMLDQMSNDDQISVTCPMLTQAMYEFVTQDSTYITLLDRTFCKQAKYNKQSKHCLYLLSNSLALVHGMQDASVMQSLLNVLGQNEAVRELIQLKLTEKSSSLEVIVDYQTKKELLIFLYYLLEFADSSLLLALPGNIALTQNETTSKVDLLNTVSETIRAYDRCDPHFVQVCLSILSLLCSEETSQKLMHSQGG